MMKKYNIEEAYHTAVENLDFEPAFLDLTPGSAT